jgi:hypothetical protein
VIAGPVLAASGVRVAFAVLELVIFASWALLFAVMIGMLMYLTVLRGRRERRRLRTPPVLSHADPHLPARLAAGDDGAVDGLCFSPDSAWLSWAGQYDLAFTRPAGSRTDPGGALASRTCTACGRAYRSELATACEYCKAERPTPWGQWRLANVTVVDE